ncbi:prepilin-type N-terminal cleavage/methylation domain-containing protein [Clostridium thermarum]|uniref:prepilin-type N-terminal cleavage/methylation domain-containing protein n=1 Tax=Clostridium thermarum TaxID=1716543 RepID=UPI00111F1442|nr:prepilin-type N-terminal cleavage/methylation domain-containing protein [Clostridium thermarum]
MLKLKIKKGYTLLESLIALSMITIIVFCGLSLHLLKVKQKNYNTALSMYLNCIETTATSLLSNCSYNELAACIGSEPMYIADENINPNTLSRNNILTLLKSSPGSGGKNIKITAVSESGVITISLQLSYLINGKLEVLSHEIYKGNYN